MFRNRTNSQKPPDELYKAFKASFASFGRDRSPAQEASQPAIADVLGLSHSRADFNDDARHPDHDLPLKEGEPTPRGHVDAWNFGASGLTPSVLDPASHSFQSFANQMPGYYTPTTGGTNTLYHSHHAGDLHTPGFAHFGLGTPLSMPTSEAVVHAGQQSLAMPSYQHIPSHLHHGAPPPSQFQSMDPYSMHHQHAFPPQNFQTAPPPFRHMDSGMGGSPPLGDAPMEMTIPRPQETMLASSKPSAATAAPAQYPHPLSHKFRYHVTLNAPTAMVKHEDEIPVTYLNKGQAYTLNVLDTAPQHSAVGRLRYRTFVRISFEDPDQRKRPAACWQLWKEGRGTNEAHHRGGRLQAVEYVESNGCAGGDGNKARVELESASFDGFCVTWTPCASGQTQCPISVRFNFLSTDFSHSKGVKGIPVRLCTKTELLLDSMSPTQSQPAPHEIAFCKVKLFRDHGAERKLSNDVAHVKKSIEKVNQQIAQMEAGLKDAGKRKRSIGGNAESQRPGKVQKHRRTWSMSSANSAGGGKTSAEDELHMKLAVLQEMFSSTRTSSVLFLKGTDEDDPDLHPVRLTGEPHDLTKVESTDASAWERQSAQSSTMVSPTPSNQSITSAGRRDSSFQNPNPASRVSSSDWKHGQRMASIDVHTANPQHLASPPDQPVKVQTGPPTGGTLSGWIEALGVDPSYRPPPERSIKPVACFYVQPRFPGTIVKDQYYRSVYLMQRTLEDFVNTLCIKVQIEPTLVMQTLRINPAGVQIVMDDSDIAEMPEGQDLKADFIPVDAPQTPARADWQSGTHDDIQVDGEFAMLHHKPGAGYELRLSF